ncbi:MAG TPA: protein kinase [Drouetiella sp.]
MMIQDSNPKVVGAISSGNSGDDHFEELLHAGQIVLDRYKVIKLLGRGGMGSVYRVHDQKMGVDFALKYLHRQQTTDIAWRRFDIEARTANKLNHPNLIKVHDVGLLPEGQPYFVMDLVQGRTLADNIQQYGPLRVIDALQVMIQVAFAMADAHDGGVIHRDIKPSNIMICDGKNVAEGSIKLVDFGIAKLTGTDEISQLTLTRTGEIFGSPYYMSPEQCAGQAVDHRSDIYSFGCVLYEALTGAPPLLSDNALTQMLKHQNEKPQSLAQASLGASFPQDLEYIVAKLLEKKPEDRYQNAHELARDLIDVEQSLKTGEPTSAFAAKQSAPSLERKNKSQSVFTKSYGPLTLPAAASLLAIGLLTGLVFGRYVIPDVPAVKPVGPTTAEQLRAVTTGTNPAPTNSAIVDTSGPFSVKAGNSNTRIFTFPADSIGRIDLNDGKHRDAVREVRIDFFRPFGLVPTDYAFAHPNVFDRFEEDELKTVDLRGCHKNLDEILRKLSKQTDLANLDLSDSTATNESVAILNNFSGLQSLRMKYVKASGASLAKQDSLLSHIKNLSLEKLDQPSALLSVLAKRAPKLEELSICRSNIGKADMEKISQCKSLKNLDLTGNHSLDDAAFEPIGRMTQLKLLDLEDVHITFASTRVLAKLQHIDVIKVESRGFNPAQQKELESYFVPNTICWLRRNAEEAAGRPEVQTDLTVDQKKFLDGSKP